MVRPNPTAHQVSHSEDRECRGVTPRPWREFPVSSWRQGNETQCLKQTTYSLPAQLPASTYYVSSACQNQWWHCLIQLRLPDVTDTLNWSHTSVKKEKSNFKRLGFANIAPSNFSLLRGGVKSLRKWPLWNGWAWTRRIEPWLPDDMGGRACGALTRVREKPGLCSATRHTQNLPRTFSQTQKEI